MEQLTYDPIRESQILPKLRLFSPLRPPEPGTALVLVPYSGAPRTVRHGEEIPDARFGTYHRTYLVDISEHRLALRVPLLSKDANFAFNGRVTLTCRVAEPAEVVARGIRDVSGAIYNHLKGMLRLTSRDYDISQFHEAEQALNASVRTFTGDTAIRLRNIHVELLVDDDELVSSGRAFRDVERETRLDSMRRERHLAMMRKDGVEGLLAEIMEREGPRATLELIASAESAERAELLSALETVLAHSDPHREPFDLLNAERTVLDRLVGGSTAPFGGTRSSRLRGSMVAGELDARPAKEAEGGTSTPSRGRPEPTTVEGHGRVRPPAREETAARPASGPPEDEPAGGSEPTASVEGDSGAGEGGGASRVSRVRGIPPSDSKR